MGALCDAMMGFSPTGPRDDRGWPDATPVQLVGDRAHFRDQPKDRGLGIRVAWLSGGKG